MTALTATAKPGAREISRARGFRVELTRDWKQAVARWNDGGTSTPFQHPQWLDAWYGAFGVKPGQALYLAPADRVRVW